MPLSEHEQRVLEQIEQSLIAEDPKFSAAVKSTDAKVIAARKVRLAVAVVVLGLVVLVAGVWLKTVPVGVLGFCIMFGGGVLGVTGIQASHQIVSGKGSGPAAGKGKPAKSHMKDRLEERLRRRFDQ